MWNRFWPQFSDTVSHGKKNKELQNVVKWKDFVPPIELWRLEFSPAEQHGVVAIMRLYEGSFKIIKMYVKRDDGFLDSTFYVAVQLIGSQTTPNSLTHFRNMKVVQRIYCSVLFLDWLESFSDFYGIPRAVCLLPLNDISWLSLLIKRNSLVFEMCMRSRKLLNLSRLTWWRQPWKVPWF